MKSNTTFDVVIYKVETRRRKTVTNYRVRRSVAGQVFAETFATRKLADSRRSELMQAATRGEPFETVTGLPRSELVAREPQRLWVDLAREFIEAKWDEFSPRHRKSTVEGLVTLTRALVLAGQSPSSEKDLRKALAYWEFNPAMRTRGTTVAREHLEQLTWIAENSLPLAEAGTPEGARMALRAIATRLDGTRAAAATVTRKRAALSGAFNYAVERRYLRHNPLRDIRSKRQLTVGAIDPRVVVNPVQAVALLGAVRDISPAVHAFFACLYYAGLRPAEARNLRVSDLCLEGQGWGEILLHGGYQDSGSAWTDDGSRGEERHLKHRADRETRPVPAHPTLVAALRVHLRDYGTGVSGRLFVTRAGRGGHPIAAPYQNPVSMSTIYRVWERARAAAFTTEQVASPLAGRPYDLRHACVSTWLHAGVDSTQVAAWAGHSVAVLMRVYASCLDGHKIVAQQRIQAAFDVALQDPGT